jgi:enoyl-CoA hydratase
MAATHFVPQIVGNQLAAKWLLTGGTFTGIEAKEMGLVVEAVDTESVVPRALALATDMAKQSPVAVQSLVRTLRNGQDVGLQQALAREADCQAHNYASADCKEGIQAIIEKRKPDFGAKL